MSRIKPQLVSPAQDFPEGPCIDQDGSLYWVNCQSGQISLLTPEGNLSCFLDTGGVPQAANFASTGDMYVCESGLSAIIQVRPDATWETLAGACDGVDFRKPNDLTVDAYNNLYFTDPGFSKPDNLIGTVHFVTPDGRVSLIDDEMAFPNGIALNGDGSLLAVVETYPRCVWLYDVLEPGVVQNKRMLWQDEDEACLPDGMAYDADGNLWVAAFGTGTIAVVSPEGKTLRRYDAGGLKPTNCCFGGPELSTLYITEVETNAVYALETGIRGQQLLADQRRAGTQAH